MSTAQMRQYIDANASLPSEVLLGVIAWFEVADGAYDAADLERSFVKHSLNPHFLPAPINPADAFEKAARGAEGLKYTVSLPGGATAQAEILVREAGRTASQIQRHMIREVKDGSNKRLSYEKVGEFVFYRPQANGSGRIDHTTANVRSALEPSLSPAEAQLLGGVRTKFDADFDRYRNYHDGQKLRGVLREYLLHLNAVLMKSSVYFVHSSRVDELVRLQAFARETEGLGLTLWQIPDLAEHRKEVIDAFQREAEKDMTGIIAAINKLRTTRKGDITPAQYLKVKAEYDAVVRRASEYSRELNLSQERTEGAAELAADALAALQADVYRSLNPDTEASA